MASATGLHATNWGSLRDENLSVQERIDLIHHVLRQRCGFVQRIAVALYDPQTDALETYAHSTVGANPLPYFHTTLAKAPALCRIVKEGKPLLINDLTCFNEGGSEHCQRILAHGYRACYTVTLFAEERLAGFVFFYSIAAGSFHPGNLDELDQVARRIASLVGGTQIHSRSRAPAPTQ